jgi:acetolactate synthase-1/2/3 large subunit
MHRLAQTLFDLGARQVFGIPGEGPSLDLLNGLERLGCTFHFVSHESAGALMAGGVGRVSGTPGVSLSIKGPGFSNMLAGIASNWLDRNPALSLSESYAPEVNPDRMHKRMAHEKMVRPVVKAYANNPSPDLLPKLWDLCSVEEPGPVHIDISNRMDRASFDAYATEAKSSQFLPPEIVRRISEARKPVVIAGALASRRPWRCKLAALSLPVFTTVAGKGAIDESLSHAAGVFTNNGGILTPEYKILPMADLIVGLGLRSTEIIDVKRLPAPLVVLDELRDKAKGLNAIGEATVYPETFAEVLEILASKEWGVAALVAAKNALKRKFGLGRWLPAGCFRLAQQLLPESTIFFLDTGNFCTVGEHVLTAARPNQIIGSGLARSMGVALPTAIGAALAGRGTPLVVVVGDGGVRMYPDTVVTAVEEKLPLLVLLMADGFLSSVRKEAVRKGLPSSWLHVNSIPWTRVFDAYGCQAEWIDCFAKLELALLKWKEDPRPLFLQLPFEPDTYMAMTDGIR